MANEKLINVPLDDETKTALEISAVENGRAVGREAAQYIKEGLRPLMERLRIRAAKARRRSA